MALPNQAYIANGVPYGGLLVEIFRNQDNPQSLGTYKCESFTPTENGIVLDRPDIDGGDNGFAVTKGAITGSALIQLATDATPTLEIGDYFSVSVKRDINGNGVNQRAVITSVGHAAEMQSYRKQSCNVRVDKFA
jgi:hypothetical protein